MGRQWALITGASAGLGREFARQLAASDKNLVLVARREEPMIAAAAELEKNFGIETRVFAADLSLPETPAAIYDYTREQDIEIDWLINNAGANGPDLLQGRNWEAHRAYFDLMITSYAALCHHFIPPMQQRGFGRVVNVASVAGLITAAGDYSYGPTKAYLVSLSKGLAASIPQDDVKVMALCPGFTHTDFHQSEALSKMKAGMPDFLWYDADVVVREGLVALEKGTSVCVSGRLYRFLVPILRSSFSQWLLNSFGLRKDALRN